MVRRAPPPDWNDLASPPLRNLKRKRTRAEIRAGLNPLSQALIERMRAPPISPQPGISFRLSLDGVEDAIDAKLKTKPERNEKSD